jgi:beta-carotene ketolase (CrtO type)
MSAIGSDVVVIGAGHNGLACACYLARAGLDVIVVEAANTPGGCIETIELPDGRGRLELGAYEHAGIRASRVAADLELEARFGLRFHLRDEVTLSPCDDGIALAFWSSLERTVNGIGQILGRPEAERYARFARWAEAGVRLLHQTEAGPAPSLRGLAALAETTLGSDSGRFLQTLLGSASVLLRAAFEDERLQGPLAHWAAHSQQSPADPGTGAGALLLAGSHGIPAARPVGGSRATIDALCRCLEAAGGRLVLGARAERVELEGDQARAVVACGERWQARRAVVSAIDARRLLLELCDQTRLPPALLQEVRRIHVGRHNVSELKVDAIIERLPPLPGPSGFERSFMLSPNTSTDIERAFASVQLGRLPERPPLMIAFPSTLEKGWANDGHAVAWISTFVPWRLETGPWAPAALEAAADATWTAAERALGSRLAVVERRVTGPLQWVARHGNPNANPNHVEMSIDQLLSFRPSPSLAAYRTPIRGLFLTGAGTHPGGGITGIPGRNSAAVVLEELGVISRRRSLEHMRERLAAVRDAARAARALGRAA